jgi:hypothetical protein
LFGQNTLPLQRFVSTLTNQYYNYKNSQKWADQKDYIR